MFLTRFGREIAIRLKSGLSTSESLDIWKLLESAVSINRNLYMLDNSELGKLKDTLGEMSELDLLQKCVPILMHEVDVPLCISRLSDRRELLDSILILKSIIDKEGDDSHKVLESDNCYEQYVALAKSKGYFPLPVSQLKELVQNIFVVALSSEETAIYKKAYNDMVELRGLLNDKLGEPKQRQYGICLSIIKSKKVIPREIYDEFRERATFSTIDTKSRKTAFVRLCEIVKKSNIMDTLSALYLGKRTLLFGKDKSSINVTPELLAENNIMLENGIVYDLFTANVCDPSDTELARESLIINPSPFFIRKWHEDLRLRGRKVKFVLARDMIVTSDFQTVVVGFLCHSTIASNFEDNSWVEIEGTITKGNYYGDIPVIEIENINKIQEPSDEYVYPPDDSFVVTSTVL